MAGNSALVKKLVEKVEIERPSVKHPRRYVPADSAQQLVGGFLLAGPFVVTEEVWRLAANMTPVHVLGVVILIAAIGYGALYKTGKNRNVRDPEKEVQVVGIPLRFISLMIVSYVSVTTLAFLFTAPETFGVSLLTTGKAISIGAIFSVVGAATADSLF